jgi:ATP/maltotriose-dependent transcriptional regulator MalT
VFADNPIDAERDLRVAFEIALRTGRREWVLACANFLAGTRMVLGDLDGAIAALDEVPDSVWSPEERGDSKETRAQIAAYRGDTEGSRALLEEAHALVGSSMGSQRVWSWALDESMVAIAEGRMDDAVAAADRIGGNWQFWSYINRLHAALRRGDLEAARKEVAAPRFRTEQGATVDAFRIGLEACVRLVEGEREAGVAGLREARRRATEIGIGWIFGDVLISAIHVLGPDDPESEAIASELRAIFERAGDVAHLARVEEAMAGRRIDGARGGTGATSGSEALAGS